MTELWPHLDICEEAIQSNDEISQRRRQDVGFEINFLVVIKFKPWELQTGLGRIVTATTRRSQTRAILLRHKQQAD